MGNVREWMIRLWGTFHPRRDNESLAQELQFHLEMAVRALNTATRASTSASSRRAERRLSI
jgi:hypothetical protein